MNSEYDRTCAKIVFSAGKTLSQLENYHLNAEKLRENKAKILGLTVSNNLT